MNDFRMWHVSPGHKYACELMRLPYIQLPMVAVIDIMHLFRNLIDDLYNQLRSQPFGFTDNHQQSFVTTYRFLQAFPNVMQYMTHDFYEVSEKTSTKEIIMQFVFAYPLLLRHVDASEDAVDLVDTLAALMYLLLLENIHAEWLDYANLLTQKFMRLWLTHAGGRRCTATKHAVLHLIEMVKYHGPLVHLAAFKDESNIVCLNRRIHHGMRVPAVLHNNIYHAAGAKHFFHDMLLKFPPAFSVRHLIQKLGPLRHTKKVHQHVGETAFISAFPTEEISRHTTVEVTTAMSRLMPGVSCTSSSIYTSFIQHNRCEFITRQNCLARPSKFKDSFVVDSDGTFWDLQYAFSTGHAEQEHAGVVGYRIKPKECWCPFGSLTHDNVMTQFCIKGTREKQMSATNASNIKYYALNVTPIADGSRNEIYLITVPFCTTFS